MPTTRFLKSKMIFLILLFLHAAASAQVKTITGVIKNEQGAPLEKATIKGTGAKEILTSADGTFSITIPETTNSLLISFTEFATEKININQKAA